MLPECINHPANEPIIKIHAWQLKACDGNTCASALLSFFEYWHRIRIQQSAKARYQNKIAIAHGDEPSQDASMLQFHNEEDLERGIMSIGKRDKIRAAIRLLTKKDFISLHRNPSSRYKFDQTRYFLFHTDKVNAWIAENAETLKNSNVEKSTIDDGKIDDEEVKTDDRSRKIDDDEVKFGDDLYTEITSKDYSRDFSLSKERDRAKPKREREILLTQEEENPNLVNESDRVDRVNSASLPVKKELQPWFRSKDLEPEPEFAKFILDWLEKQDCKKGKTTTIGDAEIWILKGEENKIRQSQVRAKWNELQAKLEADRKRLEQEAIAQRKQAELEETRSRIMDVIIEKDLEHEVMDVYELHGDMWIHAKNGNHYPSAQIDRFVLAHDIPF